MIRIIKLNNIKIGLLSGLVFTALVMSNSIWAGNWGFSCEEDAITGEISGHVSSAGISNKRDIKTFLAYSQWEGKENYNVYLYFDYLNMEGGDEGVNDIISRFKPSGEVEEYAWSIKNSKWIYPTYHRITMLEEMRTEKEFLIRIKYYREGFITFTYPLPGFNSVLFQMKKQCGFN